MHSRLTLPPRMNAGFEMIKIWQCGEMKLIEYKLKLQGTVSRVLALHTCGAVYAPPYCKIETNYVVTLQWRVEAFMLTALSTVYYVDGWESCVAV